MSTATMIMDFGTWVLCAASIPQLKSVIKNRNNLTGYSLLGTLALFLGLLAITTSFILMEMWISVIAQIIPLILWSTASYYVWRGPKKEKRVYQISSARAIEMSESISNE